MSTVQLVEVSNDCGYKYGTLVLGCLCYDNAGTGSSACGINIKPTSCSTFGTLCASACTKANWPGYFYSCYNDPYTTITSTLIYTQTATRTVTEQSMVTGSGTCSNAQTRDSNSNNNGSPTLPTSNAEKSYKQPLFVSLLALSVVAVNLIAQY